MSQSISSGCGDGWAKRSIDVKNDEKRRSLLLLISIFFSQPHVIIVVVEKKSHAFVFNGTGKYD
jgi:hypothetical protein